MSFGSACVADDLTGVARITDEEVHVPSRQGARVAAERRRAGCRRVGDAGRPVIEEAQQTEVGKLSEPGEAYPLCDKA